MHRRRRFLFEIFTIISLIYILFSPFETAYYTKNALRICAFSIIPSLFIFMVMTRILSYLCTGCLKSGKISHFFSKILNLPECLVPVCLTGLICGAPTGAYAVCKIHREGFCSQEDAERACILTGNCSAAFIMGVVSAVLGSKISSAYILMVNLATVITVYLLLFRGNKRSVLYKSPAKIKVSLYEMISESIVSSANASITLSAYVIFFYTAGSIICAKTGLFLQHFNIAASYVNTVKALIGACFELSLGVNSVQVLSGTKAILFAAIAVSFTGISIIFQVTGIMSKNNLPIRNYILSKILCVLLCPVYLTVLLIFTPVPVPVFLQNSHKNTDGVTMSDIAVLIFITAIVFVAARLLTHLDKKHKK